MRAVLQRVSTAEVTVDQHSTGHISHGWLIFLGIGKDDTDHDLDYIIDKTLNLRAFDDESGKMNLSIKDIQGQILIVSQFTLYGDCRKGRRPSFSEAAPPDLAKSIYNRAVSKLKDSGLTVATGTFQAMMQVRLHNEGPVTFTLDSRP